MVFDLAEGPVWADFIDPQPAPGQTLIDVRAAAISHVVKARASGRHYSFDGNLPFVPGIDGVGTTPQGQRVYFAFPTAPFGGMAQRAPVALQNCLPLPDALDDIERRRWPTRYVRVGIAGDTPQLQAGETVLINGATGSAGQLAVQIARYLGAKIIATGRNAQSLAALDADECIQLTADDKTLSGQFSAVSAAQIDVVIDYLWGHSAELLLPALAKYPCRQSGALCAGGFRRWRRYRVKWRSAAFRSAPADGQRDR
ncbi:zinc-binding alcohol dehydrogenase family protein [Klebsiella pneumoniae]|uniref:Zinc-binding alcohol dehydrogenase family protein n=1 Tax=Klebsiella pneumoniae TaxID=573 RepID=A0A939NU00_KLEPN|nr:zinc-binding alcohol dehydrogenase family protein [Klebsiella pneumoniae]